MRPSFCFHVLSVASCREICQCTFCGQLSCCQHRAIFSVRWREFWGWRKDALAKSCSGAGDRRGVLIRESVGERRMILTSREVRHFTVMTSSWKHLPRYWPFVRGIHRSPVNFPHKGQWRGALMFSLICTWINGWVKNAEAGDLRRHHAIMRSL